ncbi:hypothetical protein ACOQFV_24160 [Nocardiopsis changdeensis]|uniref:Uncharacterized protein n=1 Tax=Nocardiopsis changdeensis TaxID=2831969 RepID=A0A975KUZ4_9ACTN|nr:MULTISPECIES: hypothetical protein [Nocardiopsis]QUX26511.1 hypothetical protein KGD84_32965 [Nocardiopsis changdeensis]QYX40783.1 hypothetical protein K1J57_32815 [Nocardiopsis sp. MT53]
MSTTSRLPAELREHYWIGVHYQRQPRVSGINPPIQTALIKPVREPGYYPVLYHLREGRKGDGVVIRWGERIPTDRVPDNVHAELVAFAIDHDVRWQEREAERARSAAEYQALLDKEIAEEEAKRAARAAADSRPVCGIRAPHCGNCGRRIHGGGMAASLGLACGPDCFDDMDNELGGHDEEYQHPG